MPSVRVYKKDFGEIEFPISVKVCIREIVANESRCSEVGYNGEWNWFTGRSIYNDSLVGWHGHGENGTTLGSVKGRWEYKIFI